MNKPLLAALLASTLVMGPAWAKSGHEDHGKKEKTEKHDHANEKKDEHGDHKEDHGDDHAEKEDEEKGHDDHGDHGGHEAEEAAPGVGPDKGILEASEAKGIRLGPEAIKNFEIKTQKISGNGPWVLPESARFRSGEETNLYRVREGFFKRVDFTQIKRDEKNFTVTSKDLKAGDEIVIAGIGYLRIAETTAFGGNAEGHSH